MYTSNCVFFFLVIISNKILVEKRTEDKKYVHTKRPQ
jgi:hypothetical protein